VACQTGAIYTALSVPGAWAGAGAYTFAIAITNAATVTNFYGNFSVQGVWQ
jgi:hypothetical protein